MNTRISRIFLPLLMLTLFPLQSARADSVNGQDGGQIRVSENNGVISVEYWCLVEKPILKLQKCGNLGSFTKDKFLKTMADVDAKLGTSDYHGRPYENLGLGTQFFFAAVDFFTFFSGNFGPFFASLGAGMVGEKIYDFKPLNVAVKAAQQPVNYYPNTKRLAAQLKHDIAWLNDYKLPAQDSANSAAVSSADSKSVQETAHVASVSSVAAASAQ